MEPPAAAALGRSPSRSPPAAELRLAAAASPPGPATRQSPAPSAQPGGCRSHSNVTLDPPETPTNKAALAQHADVSLAGCLPRCRGVGRYEYDEYENDGSGFRTG